MSIFDQIFFGGKKDRETEIFVPPAPPPSPPPPPPPLVSPNPNQAPAKFSEFSKLVDFSYIDETKDFDLQVPVNVGMVDSNNKVWKALTKFKTGPLKRGDRVLINVQAHMRCELPVNIEFLTLLTVTEQEPGEKKWPAGGYQAAPLPDDGENRSQQIGHYCAPNEGAQWTAPIGFPNGVWIAYRVACSSTGVSQGAMVDIYPTHQRGYATILRKAA